MTTELAPTTNVAAQIIERVLLAGDLSKLQPADKVRYYNEVCASVGLNPLTQPFEYITLQGKQTLYARKAATDQLRKLHNISVQIIKRELIDGIYTVTARATDPTGRTDEDVGAIVPPPGAADRAIALMKAETKAKRRVTLSIVGLGFLDESEVEDLQRTPHNTSVEIALESPLASLPDPDAPKQLPPPVVGEVAEVAGMTGEVVKVELIEPGNAATWGGFCAEIERMASDQGIDLDLANDCIRKIKANHAKAKVSIELDNPTSVEARRKILEAACNEKLDWKTGKGLK